MIPETVKAVVDKLNDFSGDPPVGIGELAEHLSPYRFTVLPMFDYTGRTDLAYDSLTRGRLIIIMQEAPIDNACQLHATSVCRGGSANAVLFHHALENSENGWLHTFRFPSRILYNAVVLSSGSNPFPRWQPWQTPGSGFLFQQGLRCSSSCFCSASREAGMQMPSPIASTITVVSGIIIGDAPFGAVSFPRR